MRSLFSRGADAVQCAVRIKNRQSLWPVWPALQDLEFAAFSGLTQIVRDRFSGAVALGGNAQFVRVSMLEQVRTAYGMCWDWV